MLTGAVWVPAALAVAAALVQDFEDPELLMRDPTATADLPRFAGMFSNLGVLAWTTAAVVLLGTAYLVAMWARPGVPRIAWYLTSAGLVAALLGFDDLFLLHEWVERFEIDQEIVFLSYGALVAGVGLAFRAEAASTPVTVLVAAGAMFAVSIGIDIVFEEIEDDWRIVAEDGAKFLGILALAVYAAVTAHRLLVER